MPQQNNQPVAENNVISKSESYYCIAMVVAGFVLTGSESSTMATAGINLMIHGANVYFSKNPYLRTISGLGALASVVGTFFQSPTDQAIVSTSSVVAGLSTAVAGASYLMQLNRGAEPNQLRF